MHRKALLLLLLAAACPASKVRGLDGVPASPADLDFGLLAVGGKKTLALPISNDGPIAVRFGDVSTRDPFDVAALPDQVGAGDEQNALLTFEPSQPGATEAIVVIDTNSDLVPTLAVHVHGIAYSPHLTVSPDYLDFGDVNLGDAKTLPLTIGDAAPVALNPSAQVVDDAEFTSNPTGELGSIAPGASKTIDVTFAPTVAGARQGTMALECPSCPTQTVRLIGTGVAVPKPTSCALEVKPAELDFGPLDAGATQSLAVSLASTGDGVCHVGAPYLQPGSDAAFSGAFAAIDLPPGGSAQLHIAFSPVAETHLTATGTLVVVSNDASHTGPQSVALVGTVNPPTPPPPPPGVLQVTPPSLSFTAQAPAAPGSQTITLLNSGGTAFTWSAASNDSALHAVPPSGTLAPSATATVTVSVDAQAAAGTRNSLVTVDAGSAGTAQVPVAITFTAAPPPPPPPAALSVSPLELDFSAEVGTAPDPQSVAIGNTGGQPLTWNASVDDPDVTLSPLTGSVDGGGSVFASVSVAAQGTTGTRNQTVTIDAGAAGKVAVKLVITFVETTPPPPPPQYGSSVWPKFHHDNGNTGLSAIDTSGNQGVARKVFLALPTPCQTLSSIWRCGTYQASPSLAADGTVYQIGGDGNVYGVDPNTMTVKFATHVGVPMLASAESDVTVVASGHFFIHAHGTGADLPQFFKIDGGGNIVWQNTPAGYDKNGKRIDGFDSAPAIDDQGFLYLMNEDAGKVGTWDQSAAKQFDLQLAPLELNMFTHGAALSSDRVAFWTSSGALWALDENAPKLSWSALDPALSDSTVQNFAKGSPMIARDGTLVTAFGYRTGASSSAWKFYTRLTGYKSTSSKQQLWTMLIGPTSARKGLAPRNSNVSADEELRYNLGVTSPAQGPDGTIYVGHADGIYAIDPASHQVKWAYGTASVVSSPAVSADGTVYFGSMDGYLYAVKDGNLVWQVKTGGQVNSSPAIGADGSVFVISDDGYLYAVK